ncbi:hypothetical protein CH304_04170 [Rhodococcus sp. 15-649-1-2]|nr:MULTISPECIES: hypothetical protein [Rhodococcus]OZE86091.1 hypothetical protein CH304_04170 [Rhodococcus sp. 15-649-1-2]
MPEDEKPATNRAEPDKTEQDAESRARAQRARLARVFGDVLPEQTADDRSESTSRTSADWFERERPPHHF